MAAIVLEDITNLLCSTNKGNLCGVADALESLFALYVVCCVIKRDREKERREY